ncbi:Fe2+-enterobactin ABC transporter substrate-binding protein [Serratia sp. MYb239]|uniref:Fe2+-enterobactin ABC transporter substrate-binding protein n=1 Tax=Serratia sp. MYb239 TaxID=2033438 RepID=UPI000CF5F9D5|nr:Fe2+-enterobactin ABC transporter substrate-binding protein [Serratia sp. MYb239]MCA4822126.1 Fe2+-enterobactin ABC transporter substrate-binding protein [Serratia rubidaea]
MQPSRLFPLFSTLLTFLLLLASPPGRAADAGWPRTLHTPRGDVVLQQPPQRIVSTSVTLTGSLLAINAPLVGSGATARNSTVADAQGFFTQWSQAAQARRLKPLYISEPNAEAIAAETPDLIVMSATGGDSALKLYEQLSSIAPTVVIDYGNISWQGLTQKLGEITGHEADAQAAVTRFEQRVAALKQRIALPPQPTSALVYYEDGRGMNIWTPASAQGQLLQELGFTLAPLPPDISGNHTQGKRNDIIQLSGEKMARAVSGATILLFSADGRTVKKFTGNPFLSQLPAVRQQRVYAMGLDTFRLDYYSANNLLDYLERQFANAAS